jgi:hypothetical protein
VSDAPYLSPRANTLPELESIGGPYGNRTRVAAVKEKKNLERQKMLKEQSSASSQTKERRGFTVKPEKKRG